ncbi:PLP-dependent aminotransferase family protein [Micromonospora sp. NPDC049559]|uniref:MocR-like pyridoxine biosynthesis transcription factor PdxR n=1 Tax=Micromonospora sp. NPDC049559 TaxID=3155923 RepID=UPI0034494D16
MAPDASRGADFLQLRPAAAPPKGLTDWLVAALRTAIADGRLRSGARLPATRVLADDLRVSRGVVVEAYRRLGDEGLLRARTGAGTVVTPLARPPVPAPPPAPPAGRSATGAMSPPLPLPPPVTPVELDLSPGVPDLTAFPRAMWLRAERAVLDRAGASDLGYGDPRGAPRLRQELAGWLARVRGVRAGADEIIIVAGVAQSLALLAQRLTAAGASRVAVEDPGSRGARDELAHWGLEPVPVPVDEDGLRVDELARTGLGAALLTPAHQFPTGVVLAPERRRALLAWAAAGGLVVEDDYDAEYRYDRAPVPPLQASAPEAVAYTGSTSKTLAPGLRLGWLIPPRRLHADLVAAKHASDLGSPAIPQLVLARLIATGELDRHVRLVRARHRTRRDALLAALREHLPRACVRGVAAGLHLLLTLPEAPGDVADVELAERIRAAGVLVHPLSWHRQRGGPPGLVLGYAAHPPDRLREAARRIGAVLR